jgi:phosphatidate phosphatase APP1
MPDELPDAPDDAHPGDTPPAPPAPLSTNAPTTTRPHLAARVEDRFFGVLGAWLHRRRAWQPRIEGYAGYGTGPWVRVIARVLLTPCDPHPKAPHDRRGWRSYLAVPAPGEVVRIEVAGAHVVLLADRAGYVDARIDLPTPLDPGRHPVRLTASDGSHTDTEVFVVGRDVTFGVVSDIDDTVMDTRLPRPFIAAWNTFVLHPRARHAVPGMADFYARLRERHPDAPFVYLSTGAWNTATTLRRFLDVHGFPQGPLLLTDWGPTNSGWFRSGAAHKRAQLDRLVGELPSVRWLLVGDDGQHDPQIYARTAERHPRHVEAIAIRQLTPAQQVLAHGLPVPVVERPHGARHGDRGRPDPHAAGRHGVGTPGLVHPDVPVVRAPDGDQLRRALLGVVPGATGSGATGPEMTGSSEP